jgi:hypothetical protein
MDRRAGLILLLMGGHLGAPRVALAFFPEQALSRERHLARA